MPECVNFVHGIKDFRNSRRGKMLKGRTNIDISRDCGYLMRGMAIIAIVLHNFCHIIPGVTLENESDFHSSNITNLTAAKETILQWVFDVLSFFGWYGVPVFMFLTGYGLVMKYERNKVPLSIGRFLANNFLKLFFLMLPGVMTLMVFTLAIALPHGHIGFLWISDYIFQLTMLPDLIFPWWPPNPGVFWYFGLTMEFYIIYAFLIYGKPRWWIWVIVALSIFLQLITNPESDAMVWIRHNATGWASVFVMGILYGRTRYVGCGIVSAVVVLSLLLILPSILNPVTWQFSILACVVISIFIARWSMLMPGWRQLWIWIGRLSPMIFVAHPVARTVILRIFKPESPSVIPLVAYLGLTFILALIFRIFINACYRRHLSHFTEMQSLRVEKNGTSGIR